MGGEIDYKLLRDQIRFIYIYLINVLKNIFLLFS